MNKIQLRLNYLSLYWIGMGWSWVKYPIPQVELTHNDQLVTPAAIFTCFETNKNRITKQKAKKEKKRKEKRVHNRNMEDDHHQQAGTIFRPQKLVKRACT